MKKFLNNLRRIKWDKKHVSIFVLAIIAVSLSVVKISTAYLNSDYSDGAFVRAGVVSEATDTLTFEKGDPISVHATPSFFTGSSNVTSTTYSSAILKTSPDTTSTVSMNYIVLFSITNNHFHHTSGTNAEVILTITKPDGTTLTSGVSSCLGDGGSLAYKTSGGVSGFDITEASGVFYINTQSISSSTANATVVQSWTFKVTLVKLSSDQTANAGKGMDIDFSLYSSDAFPNYSSLLYNISWVFGESAAGNDYSGSSNDSYGNPNGFNTITYITGNSSNYSTILNSNNVLFAGYCWQMVRTTDTGGVKLIYNGEPSNGTCPSGRTTHTGIVGSAATTKDLSGGAYVYGEGFTYSGTTFTLTDTVTKTWDSSNYKDLIGKYTCGTTSSSCTTLYYVGPSSNTTYGYNATAYVASYTIGSTNYAQIGTSPFSVSYISPAGVGYMFNYFNRYTNNAAQTSGALMGSDIEYKNDQYYLKNTSTTYDATHHYTCNSTTATSCSSVRYYYYNNYYITLSDGKNITETINAMLYDDDVNKYDSAIKKLLENWYKLNLADYSSYIEDVIWCGNRSMTNQTSNGWYPSGAKAIYTTFNGYSNTTDLSCTNELDQFSVSNSKAKSKYPIGLLTYTESYMLGVDNMRTTGAAYWLLSPHLFDYNDSAVRGVSTTGGLGSNNYSRVTNGVRPSISLGANVIVTGGTGTTGSPYTVGLLGE